MKNVQLYTLGNQEGYAVELPVRNGLQDPQIGPVLWNFERMVDMAGLREFHKNPGDERLSEQQQMHILNEYYYHNEEADIFLALFRVRESDAMYARMEKFTQVVESAFRKHGLL